MTRTGTSDPTWLPKSAAPKRRGRPKKTNTKPTTEPETLPRRSLRVIDLESKKYYHDAAASIPKLCDRSTLKNYANRSERITDPLRESKTAQLAAASAENTQFRLDVQLKEDQLTVERCRRVDAEKKVDALNLELATEKDRTTSLQRQVDELCAKINAMDAKFKTVHTAPSAAKTELKNEESSDTDEDESVSFAVSKKGQKCKKAAVRIDEFYVGISERKGATIPYYYDDGDCVRKFHGADPCKSHINFRCFHCNITARIENNALLLHKPHTRKCQGQPRAEFIAEQKQRRVKCVKERSKLFRFCKKVRMSSDVFVFVK